MKNIKEKSAKGLKGILMTSGGFIEDGTAYFRVYDEKDKSKFIDYPIYIYDMDITITDEDAFIKFPEGEEPFIDYSNRTLGYREEKDESLSKFNEFEKKNPPKQTDLKELKNKLKKKK